MGTDVQGKPVAAMVSIRFIKVKLYPEDGGTRFLRNVVSHVVGVSTAVWLGLSVMKSVAADRKCDIEAAGVMMQ